MLQPLQQISRALMVDLKEFLRFGFCAGYDVGFADVVENCIKSAGNRWGGFGKIGADVMLRGTAEGEE